MKKGLERVWIKTCIALWLERKIMFPLVFSWLKNHADNVL